MRTWARSALQALQRALPGPCRAARKSRYPHSSRRARTDPHRDESTKAAGSQPIVRALRARLRGQLNTRTRRGAATQNATRARRTAAVAGQNTARGHTSVRRERSERPARARARAKPRHRGRGQSKLSSTGAHARSAQGTAMQQSSRAHVSLVLLTMRRRRAGVARAGQDSLKFERCTHSGRCARRTQLGHDGMGKHLAHAHDPRCAPRAGLARCLRRPTA